MNWQHLSFSSIPNVSVSHDKSDEKYQGKETKTWFSNKLYAEIVKKKLQQCLKIANKAIVIFSLLDSLYLLCSVHFHLHTTKSFYDIRSLSPYNKGRNKGWNGRDLANNWNDKETMFPNSSSDIHSTVTFFD